MLSSYQAHTWPEIWMVGQKWRAGELPYSNSTLTFASTSTSNTSFAYESDLLQPFQLELHSRIVWSVFTHHRLLPPLLPHRKVSVSPRKRVWCVSEWELLTKCTPNTLAMCVSDEATGKTGFHPRLVSFSARFWYLLDTKYVIHRCCWYLIILAK